MCRLPPMASTSDGEPDFSKCGSFGDCGLTAKDQTIPLQGGGTSAGSVSEQGGKLGEEPLAGVPLPNFWTGIGVQVCFQDCHLLDESLSCGHCVAGKEFCNRLYHHLNQAFDSLYPSVLEYLL